MKPESGDIHIIDGLRGIQGRQLQPDTTLVTCLNTRTASRFVELP